jgi:hypothetical protein
MFVLNNFEAFVLECICSKKDNAMQYVCVFNWQLSLSKCRGKMKSRRLPLLSDPRATLGYMLPSGLEILSIPKQEIKKVKNKKDNLT